MPFTSDAIAKTITFEFVAGDPKGNSLANAVTVDDFQVAMAAAGHGANWVQQGNQHLITDWGIIIIGADTYVHFYNSCIEWAGTVLYGYLINAGVLANFQVGSDEDGGDYKGCFFFTNQTVRKIFAFGGYTKIYDSTFTSSSDSLYSIDFYGLAADPLIFKRCTVIKSYALVNSVWSFMENVEFDYNYMILQQYGLYFKVGFMFDSTVGFMAYGKFATIANLDGTWTLYNLDSPNGYVQIRAYFAHTPVLKYVDCIVGNSATRANYGLSIAGAKAMQESYSTFNFHAENGAGAAVKVYNKNDVLLLDSVLDGLGDLTGQELKYYEASQEKIDGGYITINENYTPFRVELTKATYQNETIPDIDITAGMQTTLYATLTLEELQITAVAITDCTNIGTDNGELLITVEGGDTVYGYSLDGITYQVSNHFADLEHGDYTVYVRDGELTVTDFDVTISQPVPEDYAETVLRCDLTEETLTCDLTEETLICELTE